MIFMVLFDILTDKSKQNQPTDQKFLYSDRPEIVNLGRVKARRIDDRKLIRIGINTDQLGLACGRRFYGAFTLAEIHNFRPVGV